MRRACETFLSARAGIARALAVDVRSVRASGAARTYRRAQPACDRQLISEPNQPVAWIRRVTNNLFLYIIELQAFINLIY
jgi:hypothetical protein